MIDIQMCGYIVKNKAWVHKNATGMGNYNIKGLLLSTISTPSAGYRVGILNSDGEEKSKKGGDSSGSKYVNSGGESDHKVSGEEGELVNDGRGDVWHSSSRLKKSLHEADGGPCSVWLGGIKRGSASASGCSGNFVSVSAGELAVSKRAH